jgi:hypothetical protein
MNMNMVKHYPGIYLGMVVVITLYWGLYLYRTFSQVSSTKTSGSSMFWWNFYSTAVSPVFWVSALVMFAVIVGWIGRVPRLPNP